MSRLEIAEAVQSAPATPVEGKPGRFLLQLVTPGWGTSGYYSAAVLEAAAKDGVFAAGTQMYLDHEMADGSGLDVHGNRSVKDLTAVLAEAGYWDGSAIVAEARVFGPYRSALADMAPDIGVSMRGWAETSLGAAEGKHGVIIEKIEEVASVDFVTRAGRGGKILQVIESVNQRATGRGIAEATVNDTREALTTALRDTYSGEKTYVWVRDFDDTTVWFEVDDAGDSGLYAQDYTQDADGNVALTGERTEVRVVTTYVPVNPAGQSITSESKEDTMPNIEESELAQLREASGRVTTLESERDTAIRERDEAVAERDQLRTQAAEAAQNTTIDRVLDEAVEAASIELNSFERAGIRGVAVRGDDGVVDESATRAAFDEALATLGEAGGAGTPRGGSATRTSSKPVLTKPEDYTETYGVSESMATTLAVRPRNI